MRGVHRPALQQQLDCSFCMHTRDSSSSKGEGPSRCRHRICVVLLWEEEACWEGLLMMLVVMTDVLPRTHNNYKSCNV